MPAKKCSQCSLTLSGKKSLRRHVQDIHGSNPDFCEPCKRVFVCTDGLKCHVNAKHHGDASEIGSAMARLSLLSPWKQCPNCSASFKANKARRRHVHKNHGPLPDFCDACKEPFLTQAALEQHNNDLHSSSAQLTRHVASSQAQRFVRASSAQHSGELYSCQKSNLDGFIASHIQPDDSFLSVNNRVVNWLVKILQNNATDCLRPSRIIKGGSLGKGTAVKGKSDIDLVVMLRDYDSVPTLMSRMPGLLDKLQTFLKGYPDVTVEKRTDYNVTVEVHKGGHSVSTDVLLAVDVLSNESFEDVFRKMAQYDSRTRQFCSPSLSPLQVKLYAELPTKLKSLIRLIKFWKKNKVMTMFPNSTIPTSYIFDTVILGAWDEANQPVSFDMTRATHAVLTSLIHHDNLSVILNSQLGTAYIGRRDPPFIMDPCNPFNDLYRKRMWDWGDVAKAAREWLQKPLFAGLDNTTRYRW